jgi:hypothetical protein
MESTSEAISVLALLFTVGSFWWMNWRPAKVSLGKPRSFAIQRISQGNMLVICVPLVFVNSGARPALVQNLRLIVPGLAGERRLAFNSTANSLERGAHRELATQFPVGSRETVRLFCDFVLQPTDVSFRAGKYGAELQVCLDEKEWQTLARFDLTIAEGVVSAINEADGYMPIDNFLPETGGRIAIDRFPGSI